MTENTTPDGVPRDEQAPIEADPAPIAPEPEPADDTPAELGDDTGVDGDEQADEFVGED